jgi:hypothetical protein
MTIFALSVVFAASPSANPLTAVISALSCDGRGTVRTATADETPPNLSPNIPGNATPNPASLHERIDAWIGRGLEARGVKAAARSDDAEFLRRVSLDLNGVIPTAERARRFLDDSSPEKRTKLIDDLLASPDYPLHMARVFDALLTERRVATISSYDVAASAWQAYLATAFAENRPWDRMVRELLSSD